MPVVLSSLDEEVVLAKQHNCTVIQPADTTHQQHSRPVNTTPHITTPHNPSHHYIPHTTPHITPTHSPSHSQNRCRLLFMFTVTGLSETVSGDVGKTRADVLTDSYQDHLQCGRTHFEIRAAHPDVALVVDHGNHSPRHIDHHVLPIDGFRFHLGIQGLRIGTMTQTG